MIRWLRTVSPPGGYVAFAIVGWFLTTLMPELVMRLLDGRPFQFPIRDSAGILFLAALAMAYGVFRVAAFHPVFRKEYREWLELTPWNWRLPLPIGPVQLVWQDVLYVAIMTALMFLHEDANWLMVPSAFFCGYFAAMVLALLLTGQPRHAYALTFGMGGVVFFIDVPLAVAVLLASLYGVVWQGLIRGLKQFPDWKLEGFEGQPFLQGSQQKMLDAMRNRILGWPFERLGPQRDMFWLSRGWAVAVAVLAGWWVAAAGSRAPPQLEFLLVAGTGQFGMFLATGRLVTYVWGYAPPISLWGRIRTFRWIIPRYDTVFVAPVWIVLMILLAGYVVTGLRTDPRVVAPVLMAAQVFIAFGFPPSPIEWRLTGAHRIVPANSNQAAELQQTQ